MCQLTLINFHKNFDIKDEKINKQFKDFLYVISIVNAREHQHGHGLSFYSTEEGKYILEKTKQNGILGAAVEEAEHDRLFESPLLFHVRKTSNKYTKDPLRDSNAHPFEGKNFIIAHNGTFTGKHVTANKNKEIIDSQVFHQQLEIAWKEKEKGDTFEKVLNTVLKDFYGKFALIIFKKDTKETFVIRGQAADLHKTAIRYKEKEVGYIINTEKLPMYVFNNIALRFTEFNLDFKEAPEELERYDLFKVGDKDLEKVGRINYSSVTVGTRDRRTNAWVNALDEEDSKQQSKKIKVSGVNLSWTLDHLIRGTRLSIPEVSLLFTLVGFPLPYISNKNEFIKAESKLKELYTKFYRKEKRIIMENIIDLGVSLQDFHETYCFPYFLMKEKELKDILRRINNG